MDETHANPPAPISSRGFGDAGRWRGTRPKGVGYALLAALFFGLSTPFARPALARTDPAAAAGYLYLGQAVVLTTVFWLGRMRRRRREAALDRRDAPALLISVLAGGLVAPGAFTAGLALISAHRASLLLALEIVFTLLIALGFRHERLPRRAWVGLSLLLAAGLLVALRSEPAAAPAASLAAASTDSMLGSLLIVLACAAWAVDSNATAVIAGKDATQISLIKGWAAAVGYLVGGSLVGRSPAADLRDLGLLLAVGAVGYGVSLRLYVVALRHLGAALTTSLFAVAPIIGFVASVVLLGETPAAGGWAALVLASAGVVFVSSGRHEHEHVHEAELHDHPHVHDEHHDHEHGPSDAPIDGHSHPHRHERLVHSHPHDADIHHTHEH